MKHLVFASVLLSFSLVSFADAPTAFEGVSETSETVPVMPLEPETTADRHERRTISFEHVNLVRVAGEAICDVVYDAQALEIEPDKAHGTVFLRVKPGWKESGKTETAVYFNTAEESYGLMLRVADVPSQTIVIASRVPPPSVNSSPQAPDAARMKGLRSTSFVGQIKECLLRAVHEETFATPAVAATFSRKERTFEPLVFSRREKSCNGFLLSQSRAYVTRDYTVDVLSVRNLMLVKRAVPVGAFARETQGVLALAKESDQLRAGEVTDLVFISHRSLRENNGQITLAIDSVCRKTSDIGVP